MSEYLIIVGLIAVAGIAAMGLMGNVVRTNVTGAAAELGGGDGAADIDRGTAYGGTAQADGATTRTLNNFESHNVIQ